MIVLEDAEWERVRITLRIIEQDATRVRFVERFTLLGIGFDVFRSGRGLGDGVQVLDNSSSWREDVELAIRECGRDDFDTFVNLSFRFEHVRAGWWKGRVLHQRGIDNGDRFIRLLIPRGYFAFEQFAATAFGRVRHYISRDQYAVILAHFEY